MELLSINNSGLVYNTNICITIKEYYKYICSLMYKILEQNNDKRILIIFENSNNNNYKTEEKYKKYDYIIYVYMNIEHTLVRIGGRDTLNSPLGNVSVVGIGEEKNEKYLIRLDNYSILNTKHIIIDYSIPNMIHLSESDIFKDYSKKMIYISSIIYNPCTFFISSYNRNISCLTTFMNTHEPRRRNLLDIAGSKITNINYRFSYSDIQKLYTNTKVMINIHQTDHHHTFEELRVLPAICCGVIVICERSPLTENLPYNEFIIWCDYENIMEKLDEVLKNYNEYYNNIYGNDKLNQVLFKMEDDNYNNLQNKIKEIIENTSL